MFHNPWLAAFITLICCLPWMQGVGFLTKKGVFTNATSRKIIHIGTGPLFLLCWLLFPDVPISRFLAAIVPFLIVLQLALIGFGILHDPATTKSMSRSGNQKELLKGPLFYGIIFVILTVFFWKSPLAIVPLMILCGGDGVAELVGSRVRSMAIPWKKKKTLVGSLAMVFGGAILSLIIMAVYKLSGTFNGNIDQLILPVQIISLGAALVESVSPSDFDNLTVTAAALLLTRILI